MKNTLKYLLITAMLLLTLSACAASPKVTVVEGDERDQVLAYSESIADTLLTAIDSGDYSAFSSGMSDATKKAMNETEFKKMQDLFAPKIGTYLSREVDRVEKIGENVAVNYKAKYEKEDGVKVRLVFSGSEPHQIVGLWFDSPNLRQK